MSSTPQRVILPVVLAFTLSIASTQAGIIYKSAERLIHGSGTQLEAKEEGSSDLSPFTADLLHSGYVRDEANKITGSVSAFASQTSSLTENQIQGLARGTGFGSGPETDGFGISSMKVDFDIDQTMQLTLSGQLRLIPHTDIADLNGSVAYVKLMGPEGIAMEVLLDEDHLPDRLGIVDFTKENAFTGIFPAGSYVLEAYAEGHGSHGKNRCVDFDFKLTAFDTVPVPEPATSLMVVVALGLLVRLRRRGESGSGGSWCE